MWINDCDRTESEEFCDKYMPVDLEESDFFQELKEISEEFYDKCIQVQDNIINGRLNIDWYEGESDFIVWGINAEIFEKIGGFWNFWDFVRKHLFQVRKEWIDATPLWAALKEIETQNSLLDQLFEIYKDSLWDRIVWGATIADDWILQLRDFILQNWNQFPQAVGSYLYEISSLPDNIFLSKLISFLKVYRIKNWVDETKRDFYEALQIKAAA